MNNALMGMFQQMPSGGAAQPMPQAQPQMGNIDPDTMRQLLELLAMLDRKAKTEGLTEEEMAFLRQLQAMGGGQGEVPGMGGQGEMPGMM